VPSVGACLVNISREKLIQISKPGSPAG
jgi:hypothetical protein